MKTTIQYPLYFMAKPPRLRAQHPITVAYGLQTEIPEVSSSETTTVFSTDKAFTEKGRVIDADFRIVSLGDRLFRRISDRGDFNRLLNTAYSETWGDAEVALDDISQPFLDFNTNPVTCLLQFQIGWRIAALTPGMKSKVYPPAYPGGQNWGHTEPLGRNDYSRVVHTLSAIDRDALEQGITDIGHESEKLLIINDELWIETTPPAIIVSIGPSHEQTGYAVTKRLGILPPQIRPFLDAVAFPLNQAEEADAFARRFAENLGAEDASPFPIDLTVPYRSDAENMFWFDQSATEMRNLGFNLALATHSRISCNTSNARPPKFIERLVESEQYSSQLEALEMVRSADFLKGSFDDVSPLLEDVVAIWRACKAPTAQMRTGLVSEEAEAFLLSRVAEHQDNAPIIAPMLGVPRA